MLAIRDLSHRFADRWVLSDLNLDVSRGEILAIMGSSGGGKTTLLRCIAGLLHPTKGDVLIEGTSSVDQPERAREHLGLVFQSAALFDYLNVEENILFGIRRRRHMSRKAAQQLVEQSLTDVGLPGVEKLMPAELSGGMKKRVGLARALVLEPKVLLYDEPTSGLDPVTAYAIDRLIVDTRGRLGVTGVVVSHDVNSIYRVADRIAFLHQGRIAFFGTVEQFRAVEHAEIRELVTKAHAENLQ